MTPQEIYQDLEHRDFHYDESEGKLFQYNSKSEAYEMIAFAGSLESAYYLSLEN